MKRLFSFLLLFGQILYLQAQNTNPKIGGRFFLDFSSFQADNKLDSLFPEQAIGGVEFRVISLHFKGAVAQNMDYKVQIALHGGKIRLQDVYLKIKKLPGIGGNFWLGHFPEPLTISASVSANYIIFMERNPVSGYMARRSTGLMYEHEIFNGRLGWQLGVFFDADASTGNALILDKNLHYNARLTGLLLQDKEQSRYFLLGVAFSQRHPSEGKYTYRPTQSSHLEPQFISYSATDVKQVILPAAQFALIAGPFSLQGEYVNGRIQFTDTHFSIDIPTYYGLISYFLTGEHRNYKGSYGGFGKIRVHKPFSPKDGQWGAWELAARMGYSEIKSIALNRTHLLEYTLGLNWYLNNHSRLMLNYVLSEVNGLGYEHAGMMRVQVNF